MDRELLEELKARLKDKYTPAELCELLSLTEDDILEMFEYKIMEIELDE